MAVLIVTTPNDRQAHAIKLAIERLGQVCEFLYPSDFANETQCTFDPGLESIDTRRHDESVRLIFGNYDSVWMRRTGSPVFKGNLTDLRERAAAEQCVATLISSMMREAEAGRFTASGYAATRAAAEKPYQFRMARRTGLPMPDTIISNHPEAILEFCARHGGEVVYKPLRDMVFATQRPGSTAKSYSAAPATLVGADLLGSCDIASSPAIYQAKIEKRAEIRVTVLGETVLALEKSFPEGVAGGIHVDWRLTLENAAFRRVTLPSEISAKCIRLLRDLGLVMGVFDFAVDQDGDLFFLEVNPQGQFLVGDEVCAELNHLEAMAEFLISADPHFRYSEANRVRLWEFTEILNSGAWRVQEERDRRMDVAAQQYASVTVPLNNSKAIGDIPELRRLEIHQDMARAHGA